MEFNFDKQLTPQKQIEISNIGAFALEAWNETGMFYYFLIKTILGQSVIASCGPIVPDIDTIPSNFTIRLHKMPFSETRLIKFIDFFLNDRDRKITEAREIDIDDAIEQFRDIKDYLNNLEAETF